MIITSANKFLINEKNGRDIDPFFLEQPVDDRISFARYAEIVEANQLNFILLFLKTSNKGFEMYQLFVGISSRNRLPSFVVQKYFQRTLGLPAAPQRYCLLGDEFSGRCLDADGCMSILRETSDVLLLSTNNLPSSCHDR